MYINRTVLTLDVNDFKLLSTYPDPATNLSRCVILTKCII